ncbi:MAG TPA: YchJ family metal-binding protein [Rectinemataceae bacterium]|nr:YchJ family metal-binding protein [Rectinemataceae bacterium]
MNDCPCGSGRAYSDCCEPVITGKSPAETALALMRSRYSAYVKGELDWLMKSCVGGDEGVDREATRKWAEESEWLGLKIVSTDKGGPTDDKGSVEFIADYVQGGLHDKHHEMASFVKKDGVWLYAEGSIVPETIVRAGPKVGRNDPCPCGSGKKYKQCHGK